MRIDLHVHTYGSFDSLNDPHALLRQASARGVDRLCITDHNELAVALELRAAFPERIIVGEEVKTAEHVDIIGLFLHERIPKGTPARETCERIREQGGVVYMPHPFARGKGGGGRILDRIADVIDAVESFNARLHDPALNRRAAHWARARGLPVGGGSDAHTIAEVGRAFVEMPPFTDDRESFLAALRLGRVRGTSSSRLVHVASTWAKVRHRLPGAPGARRR